MATPRILKVVCRGTAELDAKNLFYKVIGPYIESLSRLGAIPRCNPTTLTTRNLDRLIKSFEEDIVSDLDDVDARKCRRELEILYILYRALELFELQGSPVAVKYLTDVVEGKADETKADVRFELAQNEKFEGLRYQMAKVEVKDALNDSTIKDKIVRLADIVENYLTKTPTALRILIAVPTAAACEEVNKMLACLSTLVSSYVYDPSKYHKNLMKNFVESPYNCIVIISNPENLKGQHIPLGGISLAVCLDVQKDVFRKPPRWEGQIYMLLTDLENKSFQGSEILASSPKKPPATLKRALANQAGRGRKAFLTKEEQTYFDRHLKSSTKIILPSREVEGPPKSQAVSTVHLSLTRWREWQSGLQESYQVGHSKDTELLVDVFKYCDELSKKSRAANSGEYEDELAAHLRLEDVHACPDESKNESISYIGANVDTFDVETIDFLAITPEIDRYVLDSNEKITNYLSELGLYDAKKPLSQRVNEPKEIESSHGRSTVSPERHAQVELAQQHATPEVGNHRRLLSECNGIESSPLAVTGRVPMASTPFAGSAAPRANFKMTPIADRGQQLTPSSHLRERANHHDSAASPDGSRLNLTALVNIVQKRKKQKNLQYFFANKMNQQAQLSDIVEAADGSSKEEPRASNHGCETEAPNVEADIRQNIKVETSSVDLFETGVDHGKELTSPAKPQALFKNTPKRENLSDVGNLSREEQKFHEHRAPTMEPVPMQRIEVYDDDDIFDDIEILDHCSEDAKSENCVEIDRSTADAQTVQKQEKNVEKLSEAHRATKSVNSAACAKVEPKRRIRSVFDALDDLGEKEDSYSTHTAVLNIIKNIPTRSKEVEVIPEESEPEEVGNILPAEVHEELKRTLDSDENSDDLFDCVEEPAVATGEEESQDEVLAKLLKKADEASSKTTAAKPGQSSKAVVCSQEAMVMKNKGFRKQKLRDVEANVDDLERGGSSPESQKVSLSAPSVSPRRAAAAEGSKIAQMQSKSQKDYPARNSRGVPLVERSLSQIFESRSSKIRKRVRSSSESSGDSSPIQKRKKKPCSTDKATSSKPEVGRRAFKDKLRNRYFEDEAEVDSIDSVSDDEPDEPNAYEMNSFVDDEDPIPQSQGMYHRLNRELSPRKHFRRPANHVAYEDCFSQRPPSEEDSYGDDSFVEHGTVAEVTLPAEITIMQAPPTPSKKKKTKGTRRAFICDDSSEGDHDRSEERHRSVTPKPTDLLEQNDNGPEGMDAAHPNLESRSNGPEPVPKNVILVNTAIIDVLPDILIGLQRTFSESHIEPVDMDLLQNHPVDLYVGGLCIKLLTLEKLRSDEIKTLEELHRFKLVCENPVLLVMTPSSEQPASERLFRMIIEISEMNMRTFFLKNQVELLMLLKCIVKDLPPNEWLVELLESDELHILLKKPSLNVLSAAALLKENRGSAQNVIRFSSIDDVEKICHVSKKFAETICAAFRIS